MKTLTTIPDLRKTVQAWRLKGETVSLVPTMGYFHEGHLSLMRCAAEECDHVVTSLFVNPTQFGPNEDLEKYPRDLERDTKLADEVGVDILFCPSVEEVYGAHYQTTVHLDVVSRGLCGKDRPGHFDGVATVVSKLFNMVTPDVAVFGQKDFQQLALIRQLVKDLNFNVRVVGHPIVRESDGLAMSSRNKYLKGEDREVATCLYRAIQKGRAMYVENMQTLQSAEVESMARNMIEESGRCTVEYAEVVHCLSLEKMEQVTEESVLVLAMKVSGLVRLIDNGSLGRQEIN